MTSASLAFEIKATAEGASPKALKVSRRETASAAISAATGRRPDEPGAELTDRWGVAVEVRPARPGD